jgi:hypothetical protein
MKKKATYIRFWQNVLVCTTQGLAFEAFPILNFILTFEV